jgi:hypothetical protein
MRYYACHRQVYKKKLLVVCIGYNRNLLRELNVSSFLIFSGLMQSEGSSVLNPARVTALQHGYIEDEVVMWILFFFINSICSVVF